MKKAHLRRSLAAVTTAIACLVVMANPASAAVHDVEITGGTVVLSKTGVTEVVTLGGTTSCPPPTTTLPTLRVDLGTETSGASVTVPVLQSSHVQTYSNGSFLSVLTLSTGGSLAGTLSSSTTTGHTITSLRIPIRIQIYNTDTCTPVNLVCTLGALVHLNGTSTSTTSSNTFHFTGASVGTLVANPTCGAGPSQLLGTTSTITSLSGHLLT